MRDLGLLSLILLCSCASGPPIYGSGVRASETRELGSFRIVQLCVPAEVSVVVGGAAAFEVSGDDNVLPHILTELDGDTLRIEFERGFDYRLRKDIEIALATPELTGFHVNGAADVTIDKVRSDRLSVTIAGSGTIRANGSSGVLNASIGGAGVLELKDLKAREASVSIGGSGTMELFVEDRLQYSISGSGEIVYRGSPRISGSTGGSGQLRAM